MSAAAALLTLDHCQEDHAPLVGGKALGLGRLLHESLEVPPGFVICTAAYRQWLIESDLGDALDGVLAQAQGDGERVSREVERLFAAAPLPAALQQAIAEAYGALGEDVPVAVRSSAVAEDTADASFAGQQETYLWVQGVEAVLDRVVACWAGLFTPQALSYRARLDVPPGDVAMAVVVQQMVDASAAGVMITLDPTNGDPSQISIEAAHGLGAPIVGGEITPDRFTVDKVTGEIRSRVISSKPFAECFDPDRGEVGRRELSAEESDAPALTDEEVTRVAEIGVRVERALGGAQDIEWALGPGVDGPRTLHLLQARPETVWRNRPRPRLAGGGPLSGIVSLWGGAPKSTTAAS